MVCRTCSTAAAVLRESIELDLRGESTNLNEQPISHWFLLDFVGHLLHTYCQGCDCQHKSPIKQEEYAKLAGLD